jgi:UDP-N-acetylmuramoyl-tripeptide--D-alanyl-D-alanine ligase
MLTLVEIVEALIGRAVDVPDQVITEAVIDSRVAIPGSLFVALAGEKEDGHDFVVEAFERGAVLALIEKDPAGEFESVDLRGRVADELLAGIDFPCCLLVDDSLKALQIIAAHWRNRLSARVIGITGSVGKSTTKEVVAEVLSRRYKTVRNPGNLNNEIGLPLSLLQMSEGHERAVLELGFYVPGEIALLCDIAQPHVGVVTNVSQVHLERAGSMQAIVDGKAELVESLPAAPEGVAILNYDEPMVRDMSLRTDATIFYYGLTEEADLWADEIEGLGLEGVRFVLHYKGEDIHVRAPMLGRHSVHTALRAAAVGLTEGLTWQEIVGGLQNSPNQLRLVAVHGPGGAVLLDDTYNAAPSSVIAALNLLDELDGRQIAVLGDMLELGGFEERGHRMVGARAAEVVDKLITVGERARWIADEAKHAGLSEANVMQLADSKQAIEHLQGDVGQGDVVLIKGSRAIAMDTIVSALEEDE